MRSRRLLIVVGLAIAVAGLVLALWPREPGRPAPAPTAPDVAAVVLAPAAEAGTPAEGVELDEVPEGLEDWPPFSGDPPHDDVDEKDVTEPWAGPTGSVRLVIARPNGKRAPGLTARLDAFGKNPDGGFRRFGVRRTTDAQGEARWADVPVGPYGVQVPRGRNSSQGDQVEVSAGEEARVQMVVPERFKISGRVVNAQGEPVAGAQLQVDAHDDGGEPERDGLIPTASDHEGRFELDDLSDETYDVVALHAVEGAARVEARAGAENVLIKLSPGTVVFGTVRDGAGPVREYEVELKRVVHSTEPFADVLIRPFVQARVTDGGAYQLLPAVPSGAYTLTVKAGGRTKSRALQLPAFAKREEASFVFDKGAALAGRVVDQSGQPVAKAIVTATADPQDTDDHPESRTDAEGAFTLEGLTAPGYRLWALKQGYQARWTEPFAPGNRSVTLVVDALGKVRGRAVDAQRRPLTKFFVDQKQFDSETGEFEYELRSDNPTIEVRAPGIGSSVVELKGKMGETVDLGELVFRQVPDLVLTVLEEGTRAPVTDMPIGYFTMVNGVQTGMMTHRDGAFDKQGRTHLPGVLAPGVYAGCAWMACRGEVAIPPGATTATLLIKRWGTQ